MLKSSEFIPITGTFVSPMRGDTGINNWGLAEWEYDFKLYKLLGMDTIVIISCEQESGGTWTSGLDPRSTTWSEDPNLISMFFRLAGKYGLKLYLGGTVGVSNLHRGYWKEEVKANAIFYEKMLSQFGHYKCFHGIYYSLEALPWHFHYGDILEGIAEQVHKLAPEKKKLLSPILYALTGDMSSHYALKDFEAVYGEMLGRLAGKLDYCAWQDAYFCPDCRMGEIQRPALEDRYQSARKITENSGAKFWANIETFQRNHLGAGTHSDFRQIDYRSLAVKLQTAAKYADKAITFEFSTCMSPNAEWGSSRRLLERYLEMIGKDPVIIRNGITNDKC